MLAAAAGQSADPARDEPEIARSATSSGIGDGRS
jgi:hypothetical protein